MGNDRFFGDIERAREAIWAMGEDSNLLRIIKEHGMDGAQELARQLHEKQIAAEKAYAAKVAESGQGLHAADAVREAGSFAKLVEGSRGTGFGGRTGGQ